MSVRTYLESVQRLLPQAREGVVVLAYHLVNGGTDSPVDISVEAFRSQLRCLTERFEVLTLGSALASLHVRRSRPVAVLTFDDAYANFRRVAWPILSELGLPVTLYVPVGFVDGLIAPPIRGTSLPACTWDDLRRLSQEGVELGSHGVLHVNLTRVALDAVERELRDSRRAIEDRVQVPVTSFCYPQAKWNRAVTQRAAGHYSNATVAGGRRVRWGRCDPFRVSRFPVRRDLRDFPRMVDSHVWLPEAAADKVRQWLP